MEWQFGLLSFSIVQMGEAVVSNSWGTWKWTEHEGWSILRGPLWQKTPWRTGQRLVQRVTVSICPMVKNRPGGWVSCAQILTCTK